MMHNPANMQLNAAHQLHGWPVEKGAKTTPIANTTRSERVITFKNLVDLMIFDIGDLLAGTTLSCYIVHNYTRPMS